MLTICLDNKEHEIKGDELQRVRRCVDSVKRGNTAILYVGNNSRKVKPKAYKVPTLLLVGENQTERLTSKKLVEFENKLSSAESGKSQRWGFTFKVSVGESVRTIVGRDGVTTIDC